MLQRLNRYLNFSMAKKIKDLISLKMRQNFDDDDDFGLITKTFWSNVRATFFLFYFNGFPSNSNSWTANDRNRRIQISSQ